MEGENFSAARFWVETVGELGDHARGFIGEGERASPVGNTLWKPECVLGGLKLDARERVPFGFGLYDTGGFAIYIEEVIGVARLETELPHGHTRSGGYVDVSVVLDNPTGRDQLLIYYLTGFLLRCRVRSFPSDQLGLPTLANCARKRKSRCAVPA